MTPVILMTNATPWVCPDYSVRVSHRAKYVRLRLHTVNKLEIIIPKGFNRKDIPAILYRKRNWLKKALQRLLKQQPTPPSERPTQLVLEAVDEIWELRFKVLPATENQPHLNVSENRLLTVYTPCNDIATQRELIRLWTLKRARSVMLPKLQALSNQLSLPFNRLTIRTQQTRWGSCSSKGNINLNAWLLFLPKASMESVLIHELCHLKHPNHSPAFWNLVAQHDPEFQQIKNDMRHGWKFIPSWLTDK